jgi:hypothetical protein
MAKSIRDIPKKGRGRPSTGGRREGIMLRLDPDQLESVDDWIIQRDATISRPEAIRRLVELGLTVKTKARPTGRLSAALVADLAAEAIDSLGTKVKAPARPVGKPGRRLRAHELATKAIEKIIDPAAPPEERAQRRRRLTKGPEEFREARVDRQKK